jgi:hypothetical protein
MPVLSTDVKRAGPAYAWGVRRLLLVAVPALFVLSACGGYPTEPAPGRSEGDSAPAFRLPAAQGGSVALADFRNKRDVLLYFSMGPG